MSESRLIKVFVTCAGRSFKVLPVVEIERCAEYWEARSPIVQTAVVASTADGAESNMAEAIFDVLHSFEDVSLLLNYFDEQSLKYEYLEDWRF